MVGAYSVKVIILSCSLVWALQGSLHAVCQIPLPDGDTLTQQQYPDYKPYKQAGTYKQVLKEWTSAGFFLVQEMVIDGSYMFKFKREL